MNNGKVDRVLGIYTKLVKGNYINKAEEALNYGVNERSIQRDIDDIRNFYESKINEDGSIQKLSYSRIEKGYHLEKIKKQSLSNGEILAICKILLDSRAFTKKEMEDILRRLISCCTPKSSEKLVNELIINEMYHYVELRHKKSVIDDIWILGEAIRKSKYIKINYERSDKLVVNRKVQPVAIMFSEYYFYLTAFIEDKELKNNFDVINDSFPTIYRIDRIKDLKVLNENFHIPYKDRFEEGEFRKRIQFMYGGKLQKLKFKYKGNDIEAVLDRLPTAKILSQKDGEYLVVAEVFGTGIDMWIRSQGERVEVVG